MEDGVLIDVTEFAQEVGFRWPIAITAAVQRRCVTVPEACPWQDEADRLWNVLRILIATILRSLGEESSEVTFAILVRDDARSHHAEPLKAVAGPGDDAEPVITVMSLYED